MKIYCRLADNIVAEIISIPNGADIADRFTPEIIETLVPGDESVQIGMIWDGEHFAEPPPPDMPPPPPPTLDDLIAALIRKNVIAPSDLTS
jgi:hypothetical protein